MNKQTVVLIGAFMVLAILYVANFTDFLKHKNIQIHWSISRANAGAVDFRLDKPYPLLTSVEVVYTEEARTNKYPHALWHLVAESSPVLTSNFTYGLVIPGMKPKVSTALPEALQPETDYSVIVEAGSTKAEKSFSLH
jgi:hypothetical protein